MNDIHEHSFYVVSFANLNYIFSKEKSHAKLTLLELALRTNVTRE